MMSLVICEPVGAELAHPGGDLEHRGQQLGVGEHPGHEAHAQRLGRVDPPPGEQQVVASAPRRSSRGSSQLAASSVLVSPLTMPVALNSADSAAMRSSAASERHMPPP